MFKIISADISPACDHLRCTALIADIIDVQVVSACQPVSSFKCASPEAWDDGMMI